MTTSSCSFADNMKSGRRKLRSKAVSCGLAVVVMLTAVATGAHSVISAEPALMPAISIGPEQMAERAEMVASTAAIPVREWAAEETRLAPPIGATSAAKAAETGAGPLQIGFSRVIAALGDADRFAARQVWYETATGGSASAFQVTSPEAQGLRLGLRVAAIPDEALIRFYDPAAKVVHSVTGAQIKVTIQGNLAAGDTAEDAETYWSPLTEGDSQVMDIELPPGADPTDVRMAVPRLSHLFWSPPCADFVQPAAAASCHNDVTCYPEWGPESSATVLMIFTATGVSYACTGTLLNDADPTTWIPYLLSANHCISTQSAASTLQTRWFYRSATCNGGSGPYETRYNGADLLYASAITDTSFMRLRDDPPSGAAFSGWSASLPALGEWVSGLHHSEADLQKISFGEVAGYWKCVLTWGISWTASPAGATHFEVSWNSGTIEPGSSGSGVFNASHQLVGTLSGGPVTTDYCSSTMYGVYGRFDLPFNNALRFWLHSMPTIPWPWNS